MPTTVKKNVNQNVFMLDDGTKEITLVNPYGKVICKLHIRPGDVTIYDRYKALMKDFDSIIKPLSDMDIKNDGTPDFDEDWERLKRVESNIKQKINELFDTDDADALFATRSPFSSVNGAFFVENVLTVLGQVIGQAIEEEAKLAQKRVEKHLSDLNDKDVTPDAGAASDES